VSLISKINEIKNTEQMNCPHCAVKALFNFSPPKETHNIEIRDAFCQGCGEVIVQIRKVNSKLIPRGALGGLTNSKSYEQWQMAWPKEQVICIDERVPIEIRKDLNSANTLIDISPDAAAGLARRALERILKKHLELKGRDLDALITASEDFLHPRIFGILDAVRKTGNFGAHLKEDADTEELFFVENDEARLAVRAVVDLALDWFVENVKAQEFLQQITKKTDRTKKVATPNKNICS
jgi:hypothetical protein